jgi:hypothetical protein
MDIKEQIKRGDMRILMDYLYKLRESFHNNVSPLIRKSDKNVEEFLREYLWELHEKIRDICDKWFLKHFKTNKKNNYFNKTCFQGAVNELKEGFIFFSTIYETEYLIR